jgi:hypothetical protein
MEELPSALAERGLIGPMAREVPNWSLVRLDSRRGGVRRLNGRARDVTNRGDGVFSLLDLMARLSPPWQQRRERGVGWSSARPRLGGT